VLHATWMRKRTTLGREISAETVHDLAEESNEAESQTMFISCVALHTIELIEKLEQELKKPVITSSQATMWRLLRLAHIDNEIKGYGKLFLIREGG